jgi:hypothetical protein
LSPGWLADAVDAPEDAEPAIGSACDLPQKRQKRAPASMDLPHERQNIVPALATGSELDKAAPL